MFIIVAWDSLLSQNITFDIFPNAPVYRRMVRKLFFYMFLTLNNSHFRINRIILLHNFYLKLRLIYRVMIFPLVCLDFRYFEHKVRKLRIQNELTQAHRWTFDKYTRSVVRYKQFIYDLPTFFIFNSNLHKEQYMFALYNSHPICWDSILPLWSYTTTCRIYICLCIICLIIWHVGLHALT